MEGVKVKKGFDFAILEKMIYEHVVDVMKNKDGKEGKIKNISDIKMK